MWKVIELGPVRVMVGLREPSNAHWGSIEDWDLHGYLGSGSQERSYSMELNVTIKLSPCLIN
jgi:hypothetical protein